MESINWNDTRCFKTWNYNFVHEDVGNLIVEAVAVLMGDYEIYRKQAAMLLLKVLVKREFRKIILEDYESIYPYDREDGRVRTWRNNVLSIGHCEVCGSTENLEAHHILKWSDFPKGRIDPKNGECLCLECHATAHEVDGLKNLILSKAKRVKTC